MMKKKYHEVIRLAEDEDILRKITRISMIYISDIYDIGDIYRI